MRWSERLRNNKSLQKQVKNKPKKKINLKKIECRKNIHDSVENSTINHISPVIEESMTNMDSLTFNMLLTAFPVFDKKKDINIQSYIKQFDELLNQNDMAESLKILLFKSKLQGEARDIIVENNDINEESKYETFKNKVIAAFKDDNDFEKTQQNFQKLKQLPTQTITQFVKILNKCAEEYITNAGQSNNDDIKKFMDKIKLQKFLETINPQIALDVRKSGPKNFDEAVETAKKIERALNACENLELNAMASSTNNPLADSILVLTKNHEEQLNSLQRSFEELKLNRDNKQTNIKDEKFCAICETHTHDTRECYYNLKSKRGMSDRSNKPQRGNFNRDFNQCAMQNYRMPQAQNLNPNFAHQTIYNDRNIMPPPQNFNSHQPIATPSTHNYQNTYFPTQNQSTQLQQQGNIYNGGHNNSGNFNNQLPHSYQNKNNYGRSNYRQNGYRNSNNRFQRGTYKNNYMDKSKNIKRSENE